MSEKYPHYLEEKLIDNVLLTETELVVIRLVAEGKTNADIAKYMDIKEPTVKFHIKNIMNKLCAKNRTMAVGNAKELGIIE
jgi:DNA-binding NarL/FixJ family response regulator